MLTIQKYVRPSGLEEAWELNQKKRNRIIGGMLWMKLGNGSIDTAIDLCDLGLDTIEETDEAFSIGAMVTLRQLEQHTGLKAYTCGAVTDAVKDIVGVQFRNLATVGGSLWGRFGFSDVLTVFLAMDSFVELYKGGIVPLETFAAMNKDNDILVRLIVKKTPGSFVYRAMRIQRTDFPVINCTVSRLERSGAADEAAGAGPEYRAVLGARPGRGMIVRDERKALADGISEAAASAFAEYAAECCPVSGNIRGSGEYRTHLIRVLTGRALMELGGLL